MMLGQEPLTLICNMKPIKLLGEQGQETSLVISMVTKKLLPLPTQESIDT
jgi:hypothetical protein